ncbi:hypothetical protein [Planktothricoides raciborskii]|uniref:Uncharacterized protein n=1 Tax=Planktothricoides raciborskii FACHB-1370 TaxID=2949576 RepID=A0ABR8E964_9CYAN|nr:hypothetical protein [Planktothricoides raciborskii]MBD2542713.1 hypothetical protein [Planktothricoides raciborskii FACHB-1370]MBD2581540.1 hypothetical protein [Planktothricoides raciborskii FACHB-1261]
MSKTTKKRSVNFNAKFTRLILWSLFTVGLSTLPLFFSLILNLIQLPDLPKNIFIFFWKNFSSQGEALIVSAAIVGEGLSDLFSRTIGQNTKLILGGLSLLFIIMSSLLFSSISTSSISQNPDFVIQISNFSLLGALLLGLLCKTAGRS